MKKNTVEGNYSNWQIFGLTLLRVLIGWHFLYEGLIKIYTPEWTAKPYLEGAIGPFAPLFKSMAQNESILNIVNIANEWGLVLIGLGLFIGFLSKPCKISGIILLSFYYLAYPPFAGLGLNTHVEGSYWIVNKNLVEMAALVVLFLFPSSHITGIDKFLSTKETVISKVALIIALGFFALNSSGSNTPKGNHNSYEYSSTNCKQASGNWQSLFNGTGLKG